ncbi:hypothetical protein [Rhizobium herbae]|uniref:Uncharacterized protein n=1 Tax=Rhizobium herbae TaxID=508661 RepID=A0ABS4EHL7_9HYPH|nr:hypothetical protein [Rhizobium herbae]MBP1857331.1 hypothetical protein [Rhizobium herbae]
MTGGSRLRESHPQPICASFNRSRWNNKPGGKKERNCGDMPNHLSRQQMFLHRPRLYEVICLSQVKIGVQKCQSVYRSGSEYTRIKRSTQPLLMGGPARLHRIYGVKKGGYSAACKPTPPNLFQPALENCVLKSTRLKITRQYKEVTLFWHYVTLSNGKSALVDFSKVMYIVENADSGTTLHFQLESENSSGKTVPKSMTVKDSLEVLGKVLKGRKLF